MSDWRRLVELLQERGERGATTWELHDMDPPICNVTGRISDARHHGCEIEAVPEGATANGKRCFRYILRGVFSAPAWSTLPQPGKGQQALL